MLVSRSFSLRQAKETYTSFAPAPRDLLFRDATSPTARRFVKKITPLLGPAARAGAGDRVTYPASSVTAIPYFSLQLNT